jgi:dTDP-3-amino-3,4,6-trideoxy-alpha-D-glucose transaminase
VTAARIPFLDLRPGDDAEAIRAAIDGVVTRGWFVLGPELEAFEREFADAAGARSAVGVGNGTDAIALLLRAAGVGAGDEVLVPAMTAAFTGLAVTAVGAVPILVDVDPDTLTIDPAACAAAVTERTRAVVPVHLYGQAADLDGVFAVAERHHLLVVEDCCQAHLATHRGVPVGTRGVGGAFSFYPTKNLGALGDAGAVITNDREVAERVRRLRNGGQRERYRHVDAGVNSRLDEIQAAVLRIRLPRLREWTARRRQLAAAYRRALPPHVAPIVERDPGHVYHLFPVRTPEREALQTHLRRSGIETLVHYPVALTEQDAFAAGRRAACPAAERAARELLSLPLHPGLPDRDAHAIAEAVTTFPTHNTLA